MSRFPSSAMKWDMSVPLGDLPLDQLDIIFTNLFSRAVKVDGSPYSSATLMNMMNGLNQIIRRASELRSLKGIKEGLVERDFNINSHFAFTKTRMVLKAAIKQAARDGEKRQKVEVLTKEIEIAILADLEHQFLNPHGCQKRLAFYCLIRLGIRGGLDLWNLHKDLKIEQDRNGREYVRFEECKSKNNRLVF